jgi:hypothetical protein
LGSQANLTCAAKATLENKKIENRRMELNANLRQTEFSIGELDSILRVVLQEQKLIEFIGFIELIELIEFIGFVEFIEFTNTRYCCVAVLPCCS